MHDLRLKFFPGGYEVWADLDDESGTPPGKIKFLKFTK